MNKIIGVTPRTLTEENVLKEFVNETYVNALVKSGFNVIMLTLDNNTPEEVFKLCDGFLIISKARGATFSSIPYKILISIPCFFKAAWIWAFQTGGRMVLFI